MLARLEFQKNLFYHAMLQCKLSHKLCRVFFFIRHKAIPDRIVALVVCTTYDIYAITRALGVYLSNHSKVLNFKNKYLHDVPILG